MHKVHVDKKGKVDTGSIATQISTAGAPKDHAIKELPGILEEGKIFFFYRQAPSPEPLQHQTCSSHLSPVHTELLLQVT